MKEELGAVGIQAIVLGEAAAAMTGRAAWHLASAAGVGLVISQVWPDPDRKLRALFRATGLSIKRGELEVTPRIIKRESQPGGEVYTLSLPAGLCSKDFEQKQQELSEYLGAYVETEYAGGGRVTLRVMRTRLASKYKFHAEALPGALEIPIGHSRTGFLTLEFSDQTSALLIGGTPGSGKSVFFRQALANLIMTTNPRMVRLNLVDLKNGVEFSLFRRAAHVDGWAANEEEALELVGKLTDEMMKRYALLREAGAVSIDEYNAHNEPLPRHLTCVDEYANLREHKEIQARFDRLLRMSRAVGMYYAIATQRPSAETVPGVIKANIQATLAFSCRNEVNSRILLDGDEAARLSIPGRAIFQTKKNQEVQVPFLTDVEARKLITPFLRPARAAPEPRQPEVWSRADWERSRAP